MQKAKTFLSLALSIGMAVSAAGCTGGNGGDPASTSGSASPSGTAGTTAASSQSAPAEPSEASSSQAGLPLTDKKLELTWFVPLYNSNILQNANDQYCWQEIQKRTGISLEFIHPPVGSEGDTFNVRIASDDLTDLLTWNWLTYSGGPVKALGDNIIIDLKDLMDQHAPDYLSILESIPMAKANAFLDDGSAYGFIHAVPDPIITSTAGFMIRKDWLDKLGLAAPATIDDWYTVLKAIRDGDPNGNGINDEIPFITDQGGFRNLSVAWGLRYGYYPDPAQGGKVVFGPIQPAYRDFLETMAQWYAEGLIDSEFPTNARKNIDEKVLGNVAGSFFGAIGSQLGSYNITGSAQNPSFELIGIHSPQAKDGKIYSNQDFLAQGIGNQSSCVTTKNKYPEESVKLLNYLYTDDGRTLLNWGKEGESYAIGEDGKPHYTDLIMNNPDGLSKLDAVAKYAVPIYGYFSSFYLDSYSSINLSSPQQQDAAKIWADEDLSLCSPVLYPTEEESAVINKNGTDINTYTNEMILKFVIGKEPISQFDTYVENVKKMGVADVEKIYQDMFDRNKAKG